MDNASVHVLASKRGSVVPALPGDRPVPQARVAELLLEVDVLVQRHRGELAQCVEDWLQHLQAERQQPHERAYCDAFAPGTGDTRRRRRRSLTEPNMQMQHSGTGINAFGVVCSKQPEVSPQLTVDMHRIDKMAVAMAGATKKKKKKGSGDRRGDLLQSVPMTGGETLLRRLTSHRYYEACSAVLILVNAVFIGVQTQFMAIRAESDANSNQLPRADLPVAFEALQVAFCILFSVDLGLRWVCDGPVSFFRGGDVWWNVLDVGVVFLSIIDIFMSATESETPNGVFGNISAQRVIRVVRVVRVARVIRIMRFFRELRMMIFSILGSMKSLLWAMLVLAMTFYLFGVIFTAATTAHLDSVELWLSAETKSLRKAFGTLDRSVLSLFMSMSGGTDWGSYYEALRPLPQFYKALFLVFISFSVFAVVNIVTGVFVDCAFQSSQHDKDIIVHEELEAKKAYLISMRDLFEEMDADDTGCISMEEFEQKLDDERVLAYFQALKLDVSDARTVFRLLDNNGDNAVNIDEFLSGCYRLQGESRSLDMKIMQCEVRFLQENFSTIATTLAELKEQLSLPSTG